MVEPGRQPWQYCTFFRRPPHFSRDKFPTCSYRLWDEYMWDGLELREITLSRHGRCLTDGRKSHEFLSWFYASALLHPQLDFGLE